MSTRSHRRSSLVAAAVLAGCAGGHPTEPDTAPPATQVISCPAGRSWFARNQRPDGCFLDDDGAPSLRATALVALALLGDGNTMRAGPEREVLRAAVRWLVARQRDDGTFDVAGPRPVADHCLVTYALVEAFGLSRWRGPASASAGRALTAMLRMRHRDGGWAVAPDEVGVDGVSTAWGVLACRSAREFAIEPETPSAAELRRWLDGVATDTTRAAAAVLVARQRLDEGDGDATAAATADHLLERTDPAHPEATFWTTYALYRIGGERWRRWSLALRGALLRSQQADGEQRGSWSPAPGSSRVVTTALNTLTLEAYFRYSRLVR